MKSEVAEDDDEDDEKQDTEKDVEEGDADTLQDDGDVKLEDLEEPNGVEDNKEVGFMYDETDHIIFSVLNWH